MFLWKKLLLVCLMAVALSQKLTAEGSEINVLPQDQRVLVEVYAETLCPYCHKFIDGPLREALQAKDIWKIARFRMIPFGNCKINKTGDRYSFGCQHGQEECKGNIIETCAFELYDEVRAWQYVLCLEESEKQWNKDARECAKQVGFDWETIRSCTNSRIGHERQFAAGLETKFIGLRSVPHVRYNGLVDDSGLLRQNPLQFICQYYADQPAIEACEPFFEA